MLVSTVDICGPILTLTQMSFSDIIEKLELLKNRGAIMGLRLIDILNQPNLPHYEVNCILAEICHIIKKNAFIKYLDLGEIYLQEEYAKNYLNKFPEALELNHAITEFRYTFFVIKKSLPQSQSIKTLDAPSKQYNDKLASSLNDYIRRNQELAKQMHLDYNVVEVCDIIENYLGKGVSPYAAPSIEEPAGDSLAQKAVSKVDMKLLDYLISQNIYLDVTYYFSMPVIRQSSETVILNIFKLALSKRELYHFVNLKFLHHYHWLINQHQVLPSGITRKQLINRLITYNKQNSSEPYLTIRKILPEKDPNKKFTWLYPENMNSEGRELLIKSDLKLTNKTLCCLDLARHTYLYGVSSGGLTSGPQYDFGKANLQLIEQVARNILFDYSNLSGALFRLCDLSSSSFYGTSLVKNCFRNNTMYNADFSEAWLHNTIFIECNMQYARFTNAVLDNVTFIRCDLRNASFSEARFHDVYQVGFFKKNHFVTFQACNLCEVYLTPAQRKLSKLKFSININSILPTKCSSIKKEAKSIIENIQKTSLRSVFQKLSESKAENFSCLTTQELKKLYHYRGKKKQIKNFVEKYSPSIKKANRTKVYELYLTRIFTFLPSHLCHYITQFMKGQLPSEPFINSKTNKLYHKVISKIPSGGR